MLGSSTRLFIAMNITPSLNTDTYLTIVCLSIDPSIQILIFTFLFAINAPIYPKVGQSQNSTTLI